MDMNKHTVEHLREMIGYAPRERRGVGNGFHRIELEQMRALVMMGVGTRKISAVMQCDHRKPIELRRSMGLKIVLRRASCHPEKLHRAKGLCAQCYDNQRVRVRRKSTTCA